jgi:hypothetical protein
MTATAALTRRTSAVIRPLWAGLLVLVCLAVGVIIPKAINAVPSARDLTFLIAGVAIAGIGMFRPPFAVVASVVAFVFSGLLRRVFPAADPTKDICAIVPFIVAIPVAVQGVRTHKPLPVSLLLGWFTVMAARSLGSPLVSAAGWMNVVVPLAAAFGVRRIDRGTEILLRALVGCATVAAVYGVVQYLVPIPWDIAWLRDSQLISAGTFGNANFRPFATYASPATAAVVSAIVMLLLVYDRGPARLVLPLKAFAFGACTALVLLSQVRVIWVAFVGSLIVGTFTSRRYRLRRLVVPTLAVGAFLLLAPQGAVVLARARSFTNLAVDQSLSDRRGLLAQTGTLATPFGRGLGALSAGSRVEGDRSVDNGFLVVLGETGVVGLGLLGWVIVTAARRSTGEDRPFLALLVITNVGGLFFANIPGLLMWVLCGLTRPLEPPDPSDVVDSAAGALDSVPAR